MLERSKHGYVRTPRRYHRVSLPSVELWNFGGTVRSDNNYNFPEMLTLFSLFYSVRYRRLLVGPGSILLSVNC